MHSVFKDILTTDTLQITECGCVPPKNFYIRYVRCLGWLFGKRRLFMLSSHPGVLPIQVPIAIEGRPKL